MADDIEDIEDDEEDDGGAAGVTGPESTNPESRIIEDVGGGQGALAGHHSGRGPFGSGIAAAPSGGVPGTALASAITSPSRSVSVR